MDGRSTKGIWRPILTNLILTRKNDHTDYGCISHWKNASGTKDARKKQISVAVDRSPENGSDPQWEYGIDTGRRR